MPDKSWKLLDSRQLAAHKIVRVREDRYRFEPTQSEAVFVVCDSPDWALVIPITEDGRVVFIRQFRHGVGRTVLEIPGGVMDPGESPEQTAVRELQEETGYRPRATRYLGPVLPNPALNTASCHVVVAEGCLLADSAAPEPLEEIEVLLRPLADVPEMIRTGELAHAYTIVAFARYGEIRLPLDGRMHGN